jgi:drug/metabolite transporter (DMT)-like permease
VDRTRSSAILARFMSSDRRRAEGLVALLAVQRCFGLAPLFAKWALVPLGSFEPRALAAWRIVFGAVALGALAAWKHPRALVPARADLPRLAACALLGIVLNMWLFLEGVERTGALHAGLIVVTIPVFTYALACLAGIERARPRRVLGIALALAGALVLVLERAPVLAGAVADSGGSATGNLLIVTNCLAYSGYLVVVRALLLRHPTFVVMAWIFWLSLPSVPFLLAGGAWPDAVAPRTLLAFGYMLVFATFASYVLNAFALARVSASTVAIFIFLQPLVAGAAGVGLLGERITAPVAGAALALLAGIALVAFGPRADAGGSNGSSQRRAGRVFHSRR